MVPSAYISPSPPLSPCPQVYSLCLFLHCFPANKFFSTICLDSIYMDSRDFFLIYYLLFGNFIFFLIFIEI